MATVLVLLLSGAQTPATEEDPEGRPPQTKARPHVRSDRNGSTTEKPYSVAWKAYSID